MCQVEIDIILNSPCRRSDVERAMQRVRLKKVSGAAIAVAMERKKLLDTRIENFAKKRLQAPRLLHHSIINMNSIGATRFLIFTLALVTFQASKILAVRKIRRLPIRYVADLEAAATHEKNEDKHVEKGGGSKHEEKHHATKGEKGDKGYTEHHEFDKGEKGHHNDEGHKHIYDEKKGHDKKIHDEAGHYGEHHEGEKGEKAAKFAEDGKHQKGHSTKGEHNIFKKDEYEKRHDFYDEYHEDGDHEQHGGYHHEHENHKGGHEKKGHHDSGHDEHHHGKEKKKEGGHHHGDKKGYESKKGHNHHHRHNEKYGKKDAHESAKKWANKSKR
ncbi:histidine-rich protein PFHRP-III-like [Prorops nasuta]|uniref:histidine-rich protein PFHRP-III-like n=1 Tax=Prorops nasuta TaxID=863751 RepID=UPI0034CDD54C